MPTYYQVDSRAITWQEYRYESWLSAVLGKAIAFCRVRIPGSTDDPPVETLAPFEVPAESLPDEVRTIFHPLAASLAELGFGAAVCHAIVVPHHKTQIYWATLPHVSGLVTARLHARYWDQVAPRLRACNATFFTEFPDGVVVTSGAKPDMLSPPGWEVERQIGAQPLPLLQRHHERLVTMRQRGAVPVTTPTAVREQCERLHAQTREFHRARGVFRPLSAAEQPQQATALAPPTPGDPIDAIVHEMQRQQQATTSWWSAILTLIVSLALFVGTGFFGRSLEFTAMLVPILFFHEAGHWLAMRVFGYRNTKMFFIPFFGAAVTGKHYNVAGWKKAVVSLMGPVPGIVLGCGLGIAGLIGNSPLTQSFALVMLALNAFNLLPLLPLDGGWVLHTVLFARHPLLDIAFRVAAILGLGGLSLATGDRILFLAVGLPLALGLPAAYKVARITRQLRTAGVPETSPDAASVPYETARAIATSVREAMPANPTGLSATYALQVFESLNARPPGWLASLAILFVHGGALVVGLLMALVLVIGRTTPLGEFVRQAAKQPQLSVDPAQIKRWQGAAANDSEAKRLTVIAHFRKPLDAEGAFSWLRPEDFPQARAALFGSSVLITLPLDEQAAAEKLLANWKGAAEKASLADKAHPIAALLSLARTSEQAESQQQALEGYFAAVRLTPRAIPPWSTEWRPEQQHAAAAQARRTLAEANRLPPLTPAEQAAMRAQWRKLPNAEPAAPGKVQEMLERMHQAARERKRQHYQRMREFDHAHNQEILGWLEQNLAVPQMAAAPQMAEAPPRILELLGVADAPTSDFLAVRHGSVECAGLVLHLQSLNFVSLPDGLPELTAWLQRQGNVAFKYDVLHQPEWEAGPRDDEPDEMLDPEASP